MEDKKILEEIENLGPFLIDNHDLSTAVKTKIQQVIRLIASEENISLSEAYQKVKSSPIYSLLIDDFAESLFTDNIEIYNSLTSLENRKQR